MGANNSNSKYHENICNTPPKKNVQLLFDPRSPSDAIARTPIQIDSQVTIQSLKTYNHAMPRITGPDISIDEENHEYNHYEKKVDSKENESKFLIDIEPTLDPNKVLNDMTTNKNKQLPPY
ncbi:unnamed protein product [Rotaria sp. Silwood2]|nr:unnamed protein product [Rotaria sp. Silwood2]CAF2828169.1 unnamed protein product [Rotaria sp. Silwood2]CAF3082987.1 unnamed protein product [Rotaria sp. Silwood2]CAF3194546.1 unnamed protein product [Rotaria sp. Silwood2]CAF3981671.1 unnamed protein product [Rotaria sp. Silwood2]